MLSYINGEGVIPPEMNFRIWPCWANKLLDPLVGPSLWGKWNGWRGSINPLSATQTSQALISLLYKCMLCFSAGFSLSSTRAVIVRVSSSTSLLCWDSCELVLTYIILLLALAPGRGRMVAEGASKGSCIHPCPWNLLQGKKNQCFCLWAVIKSGGVRGDLAATEHESGGSWGVREQL